MNYLIYGNSYNLINEEIKKIIRNQEYQTFFLSETPLSEILIDLNYNSMFDENKILVFKNFEYIFQNKKDDKDNIESLIEYLKNPNENTTLIFISEEKINEKTKANKEILDLLKVIKTPIISKSYELAKVFGEFIKKQGYAISPNALNIYCEKCASNYDIAIMEFKKLKDIKKDNRLISEQDIEKYVSNYNTNDLFSFKDAVINKNIEKASSMLDELETAKMEIVPIVVMIAKEYQILYNIKVLAQMRLTNDMIGEKLGNMHPYRVKLLKEAANKYTIDSLLQIVLYLCNLDLKLVSEDNLGFDEIRKFLLEL